MWEAIELPELSQIENWHADRCLVERTRLRNELAFLYGDRARGGPPRENLRIELRTRLAAVERQIAKTRAGEA